MALRVRSKVLNAVLVWFVFLRVMAPCSMEGVTSVLDENTASVFSSFLKMRTTFSCERLVTIHKIIRRVT